MSSGGQTISIAEAITLAERENEAGNLRRAEYLYRVILGELHNRLGIVCGQQRKLDDAAASLRQAIAFRPELAAPHSNLGNVLRLQGKLDEAVAEYQHALQLGPGLADAHNNLGLTYLRLGVLDHADECFRRAVALKPDYGTALSNHLLCLNYLPRMDADEVFAEHQRWGKAHARPLPPVAHDRSPERPLRVGYVSPDFSGHVVAHFLLPIFENHDPSQVEVYGYASVLDPDALTARFRACARVWRPIAALTDDQAAEQVRRDQIDILVDLAGHTADNRLGIFARKPAPVQVTYLGYPNTTGLPTIDYRITDAIADPPEERVRATEELLRLPGPLYCYQPPPTAAEIRPLPAKVTGQLTFGSTNDLAKLNPDVVGLWCRVLQAVPTAQLRIIRHTLTARRIEALAAQFHERGIGEGRVHFQAELPAGQGYLSVYDQIDILLDVFPWTGHVTTLEALWMGVPIVTLRGRQHAGRLSASVLSRVGLEEWIADGEDQYLAIAASKAADLEALAALRAELRPRLQRSRLCDAAGFTRSLEKAYRAIWRRWCAAAER